MPGICGGKDFGNAVAAGDDVFLAGDPFANCSAGGAVARWPSTNGTVIPGFYLGSQAGLTPSDPQPLRRFAGLERQIDQFGTAVAIDARSSPIKAIVGVPGQPCATGGEECGAASESPGTHPPHRPPRGFRTNAEGLRQLREILAGLGVEVLPVELPYFTGPAACLHLLSLISLVDHDLAVIYPPLLAVPFWKVLRDRGFRLVEVPEEEFPTQGPNVLALAPGKCLMLEGNPVTRRRLEEAGCEVLTYKGREISLKAEGGPTCLTRPVWRASL